MTVQVSFVLSSKLENRFWKEEEKLKLANQFLTGVGQRGF